MFKFFVFWAVVLGSALSLGSFAPTAKKGPGVADEIMPGKILVRTIRLQEYLQNLDPDEVVESRDSLNQNNPDIFIIYKKADNGSRQLVMQLFEPNRDGKVNYVKHFEKGRLVKEEKATHHDGITDVVIEYDPATGQRKKVSQSDGLTNMWTYFQGGVIHRREVDRNFDGKPDMWVYYRNGKAYRTEIDPNFDGKKILKIDGPREIPEEVAD